MSDSPPDFSLAEKTIISRLEALGLSALRLLSKDGLKVRELPIFLMRAGCNVIAAHENESQFQASLIIRVEIEDRSVVDSSIFDQITASAASPDEAIEKCAHEFMDVTFPALHQIFSETPVAESRSFNINSFTKELGRGIEWQVSTGRLQILNDPKQEIADVFQEKSPLVFAFDTITGYLADPTLHWCRISGQCESGDIKFECYIDNEQSFEAEDELLEKFAHLDVVPRQSDWEFCQFMTIRPLGFLDEEPEEMLKDKFGFS